MATSRQLLAACALMLVTAGTAARGAGDARKFYDDDPLMREAETQDASRVRARGIGLVYDLVENLFAKHGEVRNLRALDVNTIDEVPDSSWFTNRIFARPLSIEEAVRGPLSGPGPAPGPMTVVQAKPGGVTPGFTLRDSADETWFVQFDPPGYPESATGAAVVANKFFHALGYWQAENYIAELRAELLTIGEKAVTDTPSGKIRKLDRDDLDKVFKRAARQPNGAYRMMASRGIRNVRGRFRYYGTRGDDPNDIIAHEHRRVLRALKVFGAWTNLVDLKAKNTLDALVEEHGRTVLRHYLQDVGSTFGSGALGPHDWDEGYEYLYESGPTWKRLVSFGFYLQPWQTTPYTEYHSVGRFESQAFDPVQWKPHVPTVAMLNARADDNFWAARRVMAFSDEMIRAIVKTGNYSNPSAESHLADVLIARRDKIGRTYLPAVNPIVNPQLEGSGTLTFRNAAVDAGFSEPPAGGYRVEWFSFDNRTGVSAPLAPPTTVRGTRIEVPRGILPAEAGSFVRVDVSAVGSREPSWSVPAHLYFRLTTAGWKLVGLERMPDPQRS